MTAPLPQTEALALLRAVYDLAEADVRVTVDLLGRLTGVPESRLSALLGQLRQAGLLQRDRLGLTLVGLAVALTQPEFHAQPSPAASVARPATSRRAA